jgi:cell division protein FtsA
MATQPLVAVELGTTRTVVAVGEYQDNERLVLTAVGTYPTTGVRKGQVVAVEQAETGLIAALRQAEQSGNLTIAQVLLGVSGGHILTVGNVGNSPIQGRDHVVTQDDVNEVTELAGSLNLDDSRKLLHTFSQTFSVDDMDGILDPVGMTVVDATRGTIGQVVDVILTGANDVWVVEGPYGEVLVPAIEQVLDDVDMQSGVVSVTLLDGLLDEE